MRLTLRRCAMIVVGGLVVALLASLAIGRSGALASQSDPAPAVTFSDDFERGDLAAWTRVEGLEVQRDEVLSGAVAARARSTDAPVYAVKELRDEPRELFYRVRFKLIDRGNNPVSLLSLRTPDSAPILSLSINLSGRLGYANEVTGEGVLSGTTVLADEWHEIQLRVLVNGEAGETTVWFDGRMVDRLSGAAALGSTAIGRIELGERTSGRMYDILFDDVAVGERFIPVAGLPVTGSPSLAPDVSLTGQLVQGLILALSLTLTTQGFATLALMLYTWANPALLAASGSPAVYRPPKLRFTVILPARHEEEVIAHTVHRVWNADYPKNFLEVVVVCEASDAGTIAEAQRAATKIGHANVRVVTFSDGPINKPHGLNVAVRATRHEVVTIFDAEDDVHPEIFQIVNTIMQRDRSGIVQCGVQLMDFQSTWFAAHNVLEYFFWFKSRLHFHARVGMVPLGGNTVFMRRDLIERAGGWDEACLTEDADIGIRLSILGERISITYDAEHATREETPPTVKSFIKQRTRWNQGFLQVLRKGDWRGYPRQRQRLLALYTLCYPFLQAFTGLLWIPAIAAMVALDVPVPVAMLSLLPLYALAFQYVVNLVGLFEFARFYELKVRPRDVLSFTVGFLPYQALLSAGAIRAVWRELRRQTNWEKTEHTGAHRAPAKIGPRPVGTGHGD